MGVLCGMFDSGAYPSLSLQGGCSIPINMFNLAGLGVETESYSCRMNMIMVCYRMLFKCSLSVVVIANVSALKDYHCIA